MDWRWTDSLGVALRGRGLAGRTTDLARAAERAGVGSLWIIEDYFDPGAYALAAAAAAVTERIVIGLGLGSSNRKWIEEQMSIPFKTPLRGLREGVEIVSRLLDGQRVTYAGEVFAAHDVALEAPPPVPVPILLGVKGP